MSRCQVLLSFTKFSGVADSNEVEILAILETFEGVCAFVQKDLDSYNDL